MLKSSLVAGCVVVLTLTPTAAQQPTQAQRDAIRASCRSDFMANCASVQPGGKDAFECLLRNEAKLSAPCRGAVNAIAAPAASPAPTAPAAAAPARDAAPPGQSAMPTAAAPSPPKPTHATPAAPNQKTPAAMRTAPTPATPAAPATIAAPAVAPLGPIRPMLPRRAVMILAQCRPDQERLCAGVPAGGGKIFACLAANAQQLSPICYDALARVSE